MKFLQPIIFDLPINKFTFTKIEVTVCFSIEFLIKSNIMFRFQDKGKFSPTGFETLFKITQLDTYTIVSNYSKSSQLTDHQSKSFC